MDDRIAQLEKLIRDVPDFPKPGIIFKDWFPLLRDPEAVSLAVELLAEPFRGDGLDVVVGIDARGFLLGPLIAGRLGTAFVPARKKGKLAGETIAAEYALEYGVDTIEIQLGALTAGQRVLLTDDLLATGGTAGAVASLVAQEGADLVGCAFLIELDFLKGRAQIGHERIHSLIHISS